MSAEAVGWVWRYSPVEKSALLVHLALADVTNDLHGNQLWCSTGTLCQKTRLSRRAVMIALDQLVVAGLLIENERPGRTTLYRFEMPPLPEQNLPPSASEGEQNLHPGEQILNGRGADSAYELNRTQADNPAPIFQKRDADPDCIRCHGSGTLISPTPNADKEPFSMPCACTADDYEPAPPTATKPPPGFGMPANRASA